MRQVLLQNATAILLQNATEVYYKMRQVFYYKMRQLLQNATFITNCDSTKPDRNVFFTEVDLCKPSVMQGLDLNFNLYLLVL